MPQKQISPDANKAKVLLDNLWSKVLSEQGAEIDPVLDRLVNSTFVAIRFCLPNQLLGKLVDSNLDVLCLQKQVDSGDPSLWDPRGFASKVTVPWNAQNQYVLGTSADPYVGKPLRKPRLEPNPGNVKGKDEWILLFQILNEVQIRESADYTNHVMLQTLRSIHKRFSSMLFEYYLPERISLEQTEKIVAIFLSEGSGGDRGLSVAAALFQTFGKFFQIYSEVSRHVINASDQSTGSTGDIECLDAEGNIKLAIEVKERNLTLIDIKGGIRKARKVSLQELLFNAPGIVSSENVEISDLISKTWASGTNLYRLSIEELIRVGLVLTGEPGRRDFLQNVGVQLDTYNTQPSNRKRWKELLEQL